jgi:hypothetical protein
MADKMWCPGCDSQTSGLLRCFDDGEPCPNCGLSNDAWREVALVCRARNDDSLSARFAQLRVENDRLTRQLHEAHLKLNRVNDSVRRALSG